MEHNLKWYPTIVEELSKARTNGTSPRTLEDYVGTFWDDIRAVKIVITLEDGQLCRALQGLDSEKFPLTRYEHDSFTWLQPRNELSRRGRWVGYDQTADFWRVDFRAGKDGKIDKLLWVHDAGVAAQEYVKE